MYISRSKRLPTRFPIEIKTIGASEIHIYRGLTSDISTTGLLVTFDLDTPFRTSETIVEVMCKPADVEIKFLCKIARDLSSSLSRWWEKGFYIVQINEIDLANWNQIIVDIENKEEQKAS